MINKMPSQAIVDTDFEIHKSFSTAAQTDKKKNK